MAPMYVEPGKEGDELGIEGRHRHNMHKIFGFLHVVSKVLNNHADVADDLDLCSRPVPLGSQDRDHRAAY